MWTDQAREDYRKLEARRADLARELDAASRAHDVERVRRITQRQEENALRQQSIIQQMNAPGARHAYRGPDDTYRPQFARPSDTAREKPVERQHHGRAERHGRREPVVAARVRRSFDV